MNQFPARGKRSAQSLTFVPRPNGLLLVTNEPSLIYVLRLPGPHTKSSDAKRGRCSYGDRAPSGTRRNADS